MESRPTLRKRLRLPPLPQDNRADPTSASTDVRKRRVAAIATACDRAMTDVLAAIDTLPSRAIRFRAMVAKDHRFEGLFFEGLFFEGLCFYGLSLVAACCAGIDRMRCWACRIGPRTSPGTT
ncbi:MAG: hypothetical protein WAZ48_05460 [Lysobacteraceae bacterium]